MPNLAITSFNAGELTPQIDARADIDKYGSGCRTMQNMLPRVYGPAERRPGMEYIATAKYPHQYVRLIPFVYSSTIAYMCEFGEQFVRFYYNGELLLDGAGNAIVHSTPYSVGDLPALQYRQIGDVMWLVHPKFEPRKLTRVSATEFHVGLLPLYSGPFLTRNDIANDDDITMTYAGTQTLLGTGTLTASAATFHAGHVGALFKLVHPRATTTVNLTTGGTATSSAIAVEGGFAFVTHGTWAGTVYLQRDVDGAGVWDNYRTFVGNSDTNIDLTMTEDDEDVQYRIRGVITGGSLKADITLENPLIEGIVKIWQYDSPTKVHCTVREVFNSTAATKRWAEGAWSAVNGFPAGIAFFENRIVYGGTTEQPQTLWFSRTDDYENFKMGVKDDDAFELTMAATNNIRWLEALDDVAIGTSGDEWRVASNKLGQPITPTNFSARQQSTYGSSAIQPMRSGMAALFVDYTSRKVREFTYSNDRMQYVAPDLTALAEHITEGGIVATALQKAPDNILWCVRADGVLLSMTYERDQNVVAWARHVTDGLVESVAVIPGTEEDEVWVTVKRTVGGTYWRYIERMASRTPATQADCFFVDAGVKYEGYATLTIDGLDHLEGETVAILGDGATFPDQVVNGGEVILSASVSKASVGLPYTYSLKPMRILVPTPDGSSMGGFVKIGELTISFYDTLNAKYGIDATHLFDIDWRTTEAYDSPPALYTGDQTVVMDGGFDPETPILITGSEPLPCTVRAIVVGADKVGR